MHLLSRRLPAWLEPPQITERPYQKQAGGRPRGTPRRVSGSPSPRSVRDHLQNSPELREQAWQPFYVREGEKGPIVWEAKQVWFYPNGVDDLPLEPWYLIVARNALDLEDLKYFVAQVPRETPLTALLHVGFSRWRVERCFEDQKTELGFDHFEGRSYVGLMRHPTITAATHLFLSRVGQQWRGGKKDTKNSEWTVCPIRTASSAWVQSRSLSRSAQYRAACTIHKMQSRNARARRSHRKKTLKKLHKLGIYLRDLPRCGLEHT